MWCLSIFRVIDSRCPDFPVGTQVVGFFGWRGNNFYIVGERRWYLTCILITRPHRVPCSKSRYGELFLNV